MFSERFVFWLKLAAIALFGLVLFRYFANEEPYPTGDGIEYILTTEAWKNHASPDIRPTDYCSFKADFLKHQTWESNYKRTAFDEVEQFLNEKPEIRKEYGGFYRSSSGKVYGYHFVFYSLVNVPSRALVSWLNVHPIKAFLYTNLLFWLGFFAWILFGSAKQLMKNVFLLGILFFGGSFYYCAWTHPESLTCVLVGLSLWLLLQKKFHGALLFCALATLQNQPICFLLLWMFLVVAWEYKFKVINLLIYPLYGAIAFLPSLYFYVLFGTTSLIKDAGFLSTDNVTLPRVLGFFLDLNQGMVLGIGLFLFLYFGLWVRRVWQIVQTRKFDPWDLMPFVVLAITLLVACMNNWNHGMAIINRYAVWVEVMVLMHVFVLLGDWNTRIKASLVTLCGVSQLTLLYIHLPWNRFDWSNIQHMPLAKWAMRYDPTMYNPDPQIFIARTNQVFDFTKNASPVFYFDEHNRLKKVAVHANHVDTLRYFGYVPKALNQYASARSGKELWYYINDFEQRSTKSSQEVLSLIKQSELLRILNEMSANPQWMESLQKKATQNKCSRNEQMHQDAEFIFNERHALH
ncbi:MAG: hypothetical protein EBR54_00645 [Flavobacteriia bacterium]|nr:hypothetical protein [Flavobacteriia bacterium]